MISKNGAINLEDMIIIGWFPKKYEKPFCASNQENDFFSEKII